MVGYLQHESDAVFGLYDATTPAPGIYSRFKNLQHHYVHRINAGRATTFWTGCGAIRRAAFHTVGGFDTTIDYMEDIYLGYRLTEAGFCVLLADDIQCTHLKHYTLVSLARSDLFGRAVPWTRLLLSQRGSFGALNTSQRDRAGVLATGVLVLVLLASLRWRRMLALAVVLMAYNGWLNRDFLRYAATIYDTRFSSAALLLLHLYYINCGLGFAIGTAQHVAEQRLSNSKD
jgi:GT2 family glycosyltransferase